MKPSIFVLFPLAALLGFFNHADAQIVGGFEADIDFRVIEPPHRTSSPEGQVEVAEVFMYSCLPCYRFESTLDEWLVGKPDHVNFVRIPGLWGEAAVVHARAFFAAQALDKLEETHIAFFREFHERGNQLDTIDKLSEFYARFGIERSTFETAFDNADDHVRRARELIGAYGVNGTPSIVVAGKFSTNPGMAAGSAATWFSIIEALAAAESGAE